MNPLIIDITGQRFGMWIVLKQLPSFKRQSRWLCKCDCGVDRSVTYSSLKNNTSKSCGCVSKISKTNIINTGTHKMTKTKLYRVFAGIKRRCYNKNDQAYNDYGGRGIKMCVQWLNSFEAFYNWAHDNGYKPGLTIDRKDNNGNYEPGNCRWVTRKEQALNRRSNVFITYNNITKTQSEWADDMKIDRNTIAWRVKNNWPLEKVLTNKKFK